ncbi:MAG: insulinase family protein, partial [Acidobacteria bacterium]|nr:insulinase family protein [Acidobacteriota bacterium]
MNQPNLREVTMKARIPIGRPRAWLALAVLFAAATAFPASAQTLADFEKKVTVKTLPNGWTFIIYQRSEAPVFSFATLVNVGSVQEVPGITGIA